VDDDEERRPPRGGSGVGAKAPIVELQERDTEMS
jgi:hypothetical protein